MSVAPSGRIRAIGLMSGTSLDGIDAAYLETDGQGHATTGPWLTLRYERSLCDGLRAVLGGQGPDDQIDDVERRLTEAHARAVALLIERHGLGTVDLLGFHGHTILHAPERRWTWQLGDGALLARLTGIDVVGDFRSADVAAGGEGAPFVPVYHACLTAAEDGPLAVLNIGGVANVTWIGGSDELLAFDTGPGNALIDDWVRDATGEAADYDGALAAQGEVDEHHVARFLAAPYFARTPPKSLDRNAFAPYRPDGLPPHDGAATLTAMTAVSASLAARHFPRPARRWLVTGGGRHNATLMAMLAARVGVPVAPVEALGWEGDAIEAQAFAYLAVRSVKGLPLSFPSTTGVPRPTTGGRLFPRV